MAIFHLHVKNISRGDGRSIVAAAAYRAGETLANEAEEQLSAFAGRRDVIIAEIRLPPHAPAWMSDRAALWNGVEAAEKRKDARLAKELEIALPRELPKAQWVALARAMADAYVAQGFVADLAVHNDGGHNPHAHILLTTRTIGAEGFGGKMRSADGVRFVTDARALWARIANEALAKAGIGGTIDARSHVERGIEHQPGQHRGPDRQERLARRERVRQERKAMSREPMMDDELPVPDPDGHPIAPQELHRAEARMLDEMHGHAPVAVDGGDRDAARMAVDRQNVQDLTDDQAAAYRLAPENMLDWLDSPSAQELADAAVLERWEDHMDWLNTRDAQRSEPVEDDRFEQPERDRS